MNHTAPFLLLVLIGIAGCAAPIKESVEVNSSGELVGVWHIESVAAAGVMDNSPARIQFMADGSLGGNASCNRFFGQYSFAENQLEIQDSLGATRMMCLPALMMQEDKLLKLLPGKHQVRIVQGILMLTDDAGKEQLRAVQVIEPSS